jgi:hypothetical protein
MGLMARKQRPRIKPFTSNQKCDRSYESAVTSWLGLVSRGLFPRNRDQMIFLICTGSHLRAPQLTVSRRFDRVSAAKAWKVGTPTCEDVNVLTSQVVYSVSGAGEYALSNREVLGFGGTASYDSTLNGKVLDLAIREAVDRLVEGLESGSRPAVRSGS